MPVHGRVGAKAFTFFPFLKSAARPRSGQCRRAKRKGSGGRNFCPPALPAEGGLRVGSVSAVWR